MIQTSLAIVVEGKYDKIKLAGVIDGVIIATDGFAIYKDKEKQELLRTLSRKTGLAVLTDSDNAGFQIRSFIRNICGGENIVDVYIPDLYGKEKRKAHASKEGKLGVEGVPTQVVVDAFMRAGVSAWENQDKNPAPKVTKADFFDWGLTGAENSGQKRKELIKHLNLPEHLTTNALILVLNAIATREDIGRMVSSQHND